MSSSKNEGSMQQKKIMCAECGAQKMLHEDGRMEMIKEGESKQEEKREAIPEPTKE